MSQLYLVRHGQASFLAADYDELSDLGRHQGRLLGVYWRNQGLRPDRVICGPRRRQRDTAVECLAELGIEPALALEEDAAFDEHPGEFLLRECFPAALEADPGVGQLAQAVASAPDRRARARATELLLQRVMSLWARGAFDPGAFETWQGFRARLAGALSSIIGLPGSGQNVLVFSSGGAIGALIAGVLGVRDEAALQLGYAVQNTAVSELRYSGPERISLSRFNSLAHLPDPAMWTFR